MAKKKFERTKPHVNVGTDGHVDHGKTSHLPLSLCLAKQNPDVSVRSFDSVDNARRNANGVSPSPLHVEYETPVATTRMWTALVTLTTSKT